MLEKDLPYGEIIKLRIKCLELAIERKEYPIPEAAEEYYNFILKNTSSSQILEAARDFIDKAKEFSAN
jgi:hypothetical protein